MADKVLEFIGSDSLPDAMRVNIQMEMPYDLAIKILDLIQKNMPEEEAAPSAEGEASE
ncbi:hypothetical protein KAJ83_10180 [Marivibrio halodurans]|uniref:Uncharacterized protein n=1 Tax=Marivibrio halodurans TaxID=2039722 RepID=A0A8J7SN33_9PROT|nr:hypothetical protein [Marivibrio halodurans]MBP5857376.1 hypothetical protein [Marivibrio halodurans]